MSGNSNQKISTQPYKGVRDFYPEDMFVQNHIFDTWRRVARSYGYEEYDASILEPSELYEAKSSEEIVNEQMYTFEDRGGRRVSLRPEMTPTVARLIAQKKNAYPAPIRWFSLPNVFRYEKPQRGRLREHTQLNVDIFGANPEDAVYEIISMSSDLMHAFGATPDQFVIKINNRTILNSVYEHFGLDAEQSRTLGQTLDKRAKISTEDFETKVSEILADKAPEFIALIDTPEKLIDVIGNEHKGLQNIHTLLERLQNTEIENVVFDPTLTRGFDYYTGTVFEVFDTSNANPRSLFGGGRYSQLIDSLGGGDIDAVGFGCGDVVLRDFLETYNLLPTYTPSADLMICRIDRTPEINTHIAELAHDLREAGIHVTVDTTEKKVGDQITYASKTGVPYVICIGTEEISNNTYTIKELSTGTEQSVSRSGIASHILGE